MMAVAVAAPKPLCTCPLGIRYALPVLWRCIIPRVTTCPYFPQGSLFFLIVQAMFGSVMGTLVGGVGCNTVLLSLHAPLS